MAGNETRRGIDTVRLSIAEFLSEPHSLREALVARGALDFIPYQSGLFPASALAPEMAEATGMGLAWLRDNVHIASALAESGRPDLAVPVANAALTVLNNCRDRLDGIVDGRYNPRDPLYRLPVRVQGATLEFDTEDRVQNDSTGYALWLTGGLIKDGLLRPNQQDLDTLAQTARYLGKIEYWRDADEGHWEEDKRVHASSIGAVIAGLGATRAAFDRLGYSHNIDFAALIEEGRQALTTILPYESRDIDGFEPEAQRRYDAAQLFLVEPLHVLEGEDAQRVVNDIAERLQRGIGICRYPGDTYWEPRFKHIMAAEERTAQAPGRLEKRNRLAEGVELSGTEAQWTLFDPLLSVYWGKRYRTTAEPLARQKSLGYLGRSLKQLVPTGDGRWLLPEAYYLEFIDGCNQWVANDHTPLLWSQANLLRALQVFESL